MKGISVVIPMYNKEQTIQRSVESVLQEQDIPLEVVIVDDGSSDKSLAVVNQIKDPRVKLIKQFNRGPSAARNIGAANAQFNQLIFLDADDVLHPDCVRTQFENMQNSKCALTYVSFDVVDEQTLEHERTEIITARFNSENADFEAPVDELAIRNIHSGCISISRELFATIKGFNESLRFMEITEFLLRALAKTDRVYISKSVLTHKYEDLENSQFQRVIKNIEQHELFARSIIASYHQAPPRNKGLLQKEVVETFHALMGSGNSKPAYAILADAKKQRNAFHQQGLFTRLLLAPALLFPIYVLLFKVKRLLKKQA